MSKTLPREFNSLAEQMAAERRAAVAAAVSAQEFRDRVEYKFGGLGSRSVNIDDEDDDEIIDRNLAATYLAPEPSTSNTRVTERFQKGRLRMNSKNIYLYGALLFIVMLLGSVSLFWNSMHVAVSTSRPDVEEADLVPVNREVDLLVNEGVPAEALEEAARQEAAWLAKEASNPAARSAAVDSDEEDDPDMLDGGKRDPAVADHFKLMPRKVRQRMQDKKKRKAKTVSFRGGGGAGAGGAAEDDGYR